VTVIHPEVIHLSDIRGIGIVFAAGTSSEIGNLQYFFQGRKWDQRKKRYRTKKLWDVETLRASLPPRLGHPPPQGLNPRHHARKLFLQAQRWKQ